MTHLFFSGIGTPLHKPEDVIPLLARKDKHWKKGRSAYELAHSWFTAQGVPEAIRAILDTDVAFVGAKLRKALFEKQTELDEFGRGPSQTDLLAILQTQFGTAILGVEGKVDESFGQFISQWNDYSPSKLRRLAGLIERLGLKLNSIGSLRYQLLHRTVAVLLEGQRRRVRDAALVVQSFSPSQVRAGFSDFHLFSMALDAPVFEPGKLSKPRKIGEIQLRLGWSECSPHDSNTA
jgi:hypothetical protein